MPVKSKGVFIDFVPEGYTPEALSSVEGLLQLGSHLKGISDKFLSLGAEFQDAVLTTAADGTQTTFVSSVPFSPSSAIDVLINGAVKNEGASLHYTRNAATSEIQFNTAPNENAYIKIRVWGSAIFTDTVIATNLAPNEKVTVGGFDNLSKVIVYRNGAERVEGVDWSRDNATGEITFIKGTGTNARWFVRVFN